MSKPVRARHYALVIVRQDTSGKYFIESMMIISPTFDFRVRGLNQTTWEYFYKLCCYYYVGKIITNVEPDIMRDICETESLPFHEGKLFQNIFDFMKIPEMKEFGIDFMMSYLNAGVGNHDDDSIAYNLASTLIYFRSKGYTPELFYDTIIRGYSKVWLNQRRITEEDYISIFNFPVSLEEHCSNYVLDDLSNILKLRTIKMPYELRYDAMRGGLAIIVDKINQNRDMPVSYASKYTRVKVKYHIVVECIENDEFNESKYTKMYHATGRYK